jgi:hypothetical protein
MYSLTELNGYSNTQLLFTDERPASFTTTPANVANLPLSQVIGTEGDFFEMPLPFSISNFQSVSMVYTINVQPFFGATVNWNSYPGNVQFSNPTVGIFQLSNIISDSEWEAVKQPTVYLGSDTSGNLLYTANLKPSADSDTITWSINAVLADTSEINTGVLPSFFYNQEEPITFNSGLLVTDNNPAGTYSIFISKSVTSAGNITSSGTGGTSTSSGQGNLTIAGNKAEVNSHLGNITYTPAAGMASNFTITYAVTNVTGNLTSLATQLMKIGNINNGITDMYFTREYTTNLSSLLFANNVPYITEITPTTDTYTINFKLNNNIGFIALNNDFINRTGWNTSTTSYTFSGSLDQCNQIMGNLKIYPARDVSISTTVLYTQRKNGFFQLDTTFDLNNIFSNAAITGSGIITIPGQNQTVDLRDYLTYERLYLLDADVLLTSGGGLQSTQTRSFNFQGLNITSHPSGAGGGNYFYARKFNFKAPESYSVTVGAAGGGSAWGSISLLPGADSTPASLSTTLRTSGVIDPPIQTSTGVPNWGSQIALTSTRNGAGANSGTGFLGGIGLDWLRYEANGNWYSAGGAGAGSSPRTEGLGGALNAGGRPFWNGSVFVNGSGGSGVTLNITGTSIEYCRGAPGRGASNSGVTNLFTFGSGGSPGALILNFYQSETASATNGNIALVGDSSGFFSGNASSYITSSLNQTIGSSNFTFECWVYSTDTTSNDRCIWDNRLDSTGGTGSWGFAIKQTGTNQFSFIAGNTSTTAISWTRRNNQWQHIALVRQNGVITVYSDGIAVGSTTQGGTLFYSRANWRIGAFRDDAGSNVTFKGYIDELRLSNVARYVGSFTPASYPWDADNNSLLHLRFDGSNGSTVFTDSSPYANVISAIGDVSISTAQYRY